MIESTLFQSTYENQRWTPVNGFSSSLLPTDRPVFSSADGRAARNKKDVKLPTLAWQWESEWYVDTNFNGTQLDKDVSDILSCHVIEKRSLLSGLDVRDRLPR